MTPERSKSWRQISTGVLVALTGPAFFLVLTLLVGQGLVTVDKLINWTPIVALGVVLGPVGIAIACRGAGVRSIFVWLVLVVAAVPVLLSAWFFSLVSFSGAMGEPF